MILVACGWRHTISVSSSGGLYTYGWSKYGQLGHGDFKHHLVPHKLEALQEHCISHISGGWRHTMALTSDGKLYGWGWNKFGQVAVGDNQDHCFPVQVKFPDEQAHHFSIKGTNGQLGHREAIDRSIPKIVEALSMDGSSGQQIESSWTDPSSGKLSVLPSDRYAVVPDEIAKARTNENDANVPENDVKRIKL
ncbi:hypothetical protein L6452_02131 [Arctium lappa]|uniref:Uncharacterized protein n=1 Tax=Arctium lappa TaxID=4217 RepID=A0ACB9FK25_ARCLA|nr:hypothetical protein L6452_02131 [Arctium lappa]